MVGTLVRLQLKLFGRSLNRSPGATIGTLIAGLFGLVMVLLVAKSCYQGRHAALELRGLIAIGLLSVLMAARLFALFIVGQEQTLEPSRFALFPVSGRQLAPGLFVASFLTLGGALSVLLVLASSLIWAPNLLLLGGWIVVGLLGICLSTLLNQVVAAKLAGMLHSRRFRDINTAVVGIAAAFSGVLVQVMISAFSVQNLSDIGRFRMAGLIVGWTPFGWPFAALVDLASGAWVAGAIRLVLTASSIGGLWWLWQRELAAALVSPIDAGGPSQQVKGSFPDRITPVDARRSDRRADAALLPARPAQSGSGSRHGSIATDRSRAQPDQRRRASRQLPHRTRRAVLRDFWSTDVGDRLVATDRV